VGIVKLKTGERIVYNNGDFELKSFDSKELIFQRGSKSIKLPFREVVAIYPPKKDSQ